MTTITQYAIARLTEDSFEYWRPAEDYADARQLIAALDRLAQRQGRFIVICRTQKVTMSAWHPLKRGHACT